MFCVRRTVVLEALLWLKKNNALYGDVDVSEDQLEMLPTDDVPDEVQALVRQETNEFLAIRERESYIPDTAEQSCSSEFNREYSPMQVAVILLTCTTVTAEDENQDNEGATNNFGKRNQGTFSL